MALWWPLRRSEESKRKSKPATNLDMHPTSSRQDCNCVLSNAVSTVFYKFIKVQFREVVALVTD